MTWRFFFIEWEFRNRKNDTDESIAEIFPGFHYFYQRNGYSGIADNRYKEADTVPIPKYSDYNRYHRRKFTNGWESRSARSDGRS